MLKLKPQYFGTWCKELTHWTRHWCWERLKAGEEGDDRGWDGWLASPIQWTGVWASSRSWWWTGKPGMLQSMGSQRVGHDWVNELNWTEVTNPLIIITALNLGVNEPASSFQQTNIHQVLNWEGKKTTKKTTLSWNSLKRMVYIYFLMSVWVQKYNYLKFHEPVLGIFSAQARLMQ